MDMGTRKEFKAWARVLQMLTNVELLHSPKKVVVQQPKYWDKHGDNKRREKMHWEQMTIYSCDVSKETVQEQPTLLILFGVRLIVNRRNCFVLLMPSAKTIKELVSFIGSD